MLALRASRCVGGARRLLTGGVVGDGLVGVSTVGGDSRIGLLTLQKKPVNSLDTEMLTAIADGVAALEAQPGVKAFVLTSAWEGKVFSAGLDLLEMHEPDDRASLEEFWTAVQDAWLALYTTPLATVASINGTSPAGGCLLATACDYRVMSENPKFTIGLNEAQFGLVAPDFFLDVYTNVVGQRNAEWLAGTGALLDPASALAVSLVDEVLPQGDVGPRSAAVAEKLAKLPFDARAETKRRLRLKTATNLRDTKAQCTATFCDFALQDDVQAALTAYVASLKARKN